VSVVYAQENDYGSILRQLDEAIELSPETVAQYEQQTEGVYRQYQNARTPEEKYGLAFQLYEQYKAFMNDSALTISVRQSDGQRNRETMYLWVIVGR